MLWIATEHFRPDAVSTGLLLTQIAEHLARDIEVKVVCGWPAAQRPEIRAPRRERLGSMSVERFSSYAGDRASLLRRGAGAIRFSSSVFWRVATSARPSDCILVVTNPPLLPYAMMLAARFRGARCALLVYDVYPEALVASGALKSGPSIRLLQAASRWMHSSASRLIVLGRDMKVLVAAKTGSLERITIVPNWADLDLITPLRREELLEELGLEDRFVVQYSGNMGRTHALELLVDAAAKLSGTSVHFLLIGSGAKRQWLEAAVRKRGLQNVSIMDPQPREGLATSLAGCDLAIIPFVPGMSGISVPSRMYNIFAAGRPVLAVAESDTELALLVEEHGMGWVSPPGDVDALVSLLIELERDRERVRQAGSAARRFAVAQCASERSLTAIQEIVKSLMSEPTPISA